MHPLNRGASEPGEKGVTREAGWNLSSTWLRRPAFSGLVALAARCLRRMYTNNTPHAIIDATKAMLTPIAAAVPDVEEELDIIVQ